MRDLLAATTAVTLAVGLLAPVPGLAGGHAGGRSFFANDRNSLLLVDPDTGAARTVMGLPDRTTDLARGADGTLYACTEQELLRLDPDAGTWTVVGPFGVTVGMNALASAPNGTLYGAGWDGGIYRIEPVSGAAERIASLPGGWKSAGDLVVLPQDRLLLVASRDDRTTDRLAWLDLARSDVTLGADLGVDKVYGLALRGRTVVLFTETGKVLAVNPYTGETRRLLTVSAAFWGVEERL